MVGIGPGGPAHRTMAAVEAIRQSSLIVGYTPYVESVADLLDGQATFVSGMRQEIERVRAALIAAQEGKVVSLLSSGDAGIYGMAGLAIELAAAESLDVNIEILPGVSAANAAAAALGAPLMLDFATISLSDLMVPWAMIRQRIEGVATGDLVVALYNPRSKKRTWQLPEAIEILRQQRPGETPAGIVTAAGTDEQEVLLTSLDQVNEQVITMRSVIIIGNSQTRLVGGKMVTVRGYAL